LDLPTSLVSIQAPQIIAPGIGANAEIRAAYLALGGASRTVANTTPTSGTLTLAASLIDVSYLLTRGYAETRLVADDIRFAPPTTGATSQVNVDATLRLRAADVYPDTGVTATVTAGSRIVIEQNGVAGLPPLSAGGSLTLTAPQIDVDGTLRAPFGSIKVSA